MVPPPGAAAQAEAARAKIAEEMGERTTRMDSEMAWLDADTPVASSETSERRAVGNSNKEDQKIRLNGMKCTARLLQQMRLVLSICFWSVLLPFRMGEAALQGVNAHADATRGKAMHRLAPPTPQYGGGC